MKCSVSQCVTPRRCVNSPNIFSHGEVVSSRVGVVQRGTFLNMASGCTTNYGL